MKQVYVAIVAALGLILAVFILGNAYKYKFHATENITVTGLAERDFSSDLINWSGSYNRVGMDLKLAYAELKEDENKIRAYLVSKGVNDKELLFSAISIEKIFNNKYDSEGRTVGSEFAGYNLSQTVTVNSKNIDQVEKISREVTELIEQGVELNSSAPSYFYSKLSELKIDLLAKASADAKLRAETIAKHAGNRLGKVRSANMGIFQITGKNSHEDYSSGGVFNTTNREKTASITIKMEFAVD